MYNNNDYSWGCLSIVSIIIMAFFIITFFKNMNNSEEIRSMEQLSKMINIDELELGEPIKPNIWFISIKRLKNIKMDNKKYVYGYALYDCYFSLPKKPEKPFETYLYINNKRYIISDNKDLYNAVNALLKKMRKNVKGQIKIIEFMENDSFFPKAFSFYTDFLVTKSIF